MARGSNIRVIALVLFISMTMDLAHSAASPSPPSLVCGAHRNYYCPFLCPQFCAPYCGNLRYRYYKCVKDTTKPSVKFAQCKIKNDYLWSCRCC